MDAAPVFIKRGEERRLRTGHPWIYSNEIDTSKTPLGQFIPGEPVSVRSHRGEILGLGYINPHSLITIRLLSRDPQRSIAELISERIALANQERQSLDRDSYRMVFAESDGLPGLIIDRYVDVYVVQISTAGMERYREAIVSSLQMIGRPRAIVLRNDTPARDLEGIERYVEVTFGHLPDRVVLEEGGCTFEVDPLSGQKTGWFFDHYDNRRAFLPFIGNTRVLDVFSYIGAWGVQAARMGAEVTAIDSASNAIAQLVHHAQLNGVRSRVNGYCEDAFDALKRLRQQGQLFDAVIVDPPAFIRRRKHRIKGLEAYRRVNGLAMQLIAPGGMLVSSSCSSHLEREKLAEIIGRVAYGINREARIVHEGRQASDHPVHPGLPETGYLKAFFIRLRD